MVTKIIGPERAAFLKFELSMGDPRRKKVALQECCRLYRNNYRLRAEDRNEIETSINGIVLIANQDQKVVRWCLNALAQIGRRHYSTKYIESALRQYEGNPEITAAGVAALYSLYQGEIESLSILGVVEPEIRILAALQNTPANKIDLARFRIDIDRADPEVLKLALITVGLNRDIENLFHPRHDNGQIVKALGRYPDPIVVQYSVWAVIENLRLTISDLGVPLDTVDSHPPNVQSKLLQLAVEKETDAGLRHETIHRGTFLTALEAREGLAKGLTHRFYDGLEEITIPWFGQETSFRVRELVAEHFARFSGDCAPYEDQSMTILESEPSLIRRLLVGAERTPLYRVIKASNIREGTQDLFANADNELVEMIRQAHSIDGKGKAMTKVLVLSASPLGEKNLRLDEEAREIDDALRSVSDATKHISVARSWAVRTDQIQDAILREKPKILQFSGHGGKVELCFENKLGTVAPVSSKAMAELMKLCADSVECLVLSACYSRDIAIAARDHISSVIGCDGSIDDDAAIAFARSFYRALAYGRSFEGAFDLARNEIRLAGMDSEADKYVYLGNKWSMDMQQFWQDRVCDPLRNGFFSARVGTRCGAADTPTLVGRCR